MQEHTEYLVRSFITNTLRFPPAELKWRQCNFRMYIVCRKECLPSNHGIMIAAKLAPPIVGKFSQMKDKNSILRLAPSARKFNAAITRHLPLAFQQQRKAFLEKAKRLYKAKKKMRWTIVVFAYSLMMNKYLLTEVGDYAGVVAYYKLVKFCVF